MLSNGKSKLFVRSLSSEIVNPRGCTVWAFLLRVDLNDTDERQESRKFLKDDDSQRFPVSKWSFFDRFVQFLRNKLSPFIIGCAFTKKKGCIAGCLSANCTCGVFGHLICAFLKVTPHESKHFKDGLFLRANFTAASSS